MKAATTHIEQPLREASAVKQRPILNEWKRRSVKLDKSGKMEMKKEGQKFDDIKRIQIGITCHTNGVIQSLASKK